MAGKWRVRFVEPLVAQQTFTAFLKASGVMMSLALMSLDTSSITLRPASSASAFKGWVRGAQGGVARQGKTESLCRNAHAVCRTHEAAGAGAWTDGALDLQ